MLKLIAKGETTSALDYEKASFIKMMAVNKGTDVTILLEDQTVTIPVQEFYDKMHWLFFEDNSHCCC